MQAMQGMYKNGIVKLNKRPPFNNVKVMVIFPEETQEKMTTEDAFSIIDKYAGSIKGNFDIENAKGEYFNEKYELLD